MCRDDNSTSIINSFEEGDRIRVLTTGGVTDTGVFIRIQAGFLIWVRDDGPTPAYTATSLDGISISKI